MKAICWVIGSPPWPDDLYLANGRIAGQFPAAALCQRGSLRDRLRRNLAGEAGKVCTNARQRRRQRPAGPEAKRAIERIDFVGFDVVRHRVAVSLDQRHG